MHAFDELNTIISKFPSEFNEPDHYVAYACALVAELAYHHVPKWEIDNEWKRAKRVPCFGHQRIFQLGSQTNLESFDANEEIPRIQVCVTNSIVSVVLKTQNFTFISFRGTVEKHDWYINFNASKKLGLWHTGFIDEASRICEKLNKLNHKQHTHKTLLCGHSLGGAIASVASRLLDQHKIVATYIFGSPRVGSLEALDELDPNSPLFHIRRQGDLVPTVPPRFFGYTDYRKEYNCYLNELDEPIEKSLVQELDDWYSFATEHARPHFMETYRSEVGLYANAQYKDEALIQYEKITKKNIRSSI